MSTFLYYLGLATLIYLCLGFAFALIAAFMAARAARHPHR